MKAQTLPGSTKYTERLNFFPEKSNVQILPQKFEFTLLNAEQMKLGDILIDTAQTQFELILPNKDDKKFNLIFTWPQALLPEGHIVLFNNYGKALWRTKIDPAFLSIVPNEKSQKTLLRSDMARMTSAAIDIKVLNEMRYLPFIKFCVYKQQENSRIQLCSQEFYFLGSKDEIQIKSRPPSLKQSRLIINDQTINGGQAIILLNDPKQNVNLRALSENGASLEFETRMTPVDFQDVFVSDDGQYLNLRADGALPAKQDRVEIINDKIWQAQISVADPVLYLLGAGGIPLRQEFYLRGPVPTESMRPYALPPLQKKTYADQILIEGMPAENTKASLKDKDSGLKTFPDGHFLWRLSNLDTDSENKRFLSFKTVNSEFAVSHKIQKGRPFQIKIYGILESPSSVLRGNLIFDWWWERFLNLNAGSQIFHWGLQIEQTPALSRKDNFADYSIARAALMYRFKPGFHFVESTWGIKIPFQNLKTSTTSYNSLGLSFFYEGKNPGFDTTLMDAFNADFNYFAATQNEAGNLKGFYEVSGLAFVKYNDLFSWSYGLAITQADFENGGDSSRLQLQGKLGISLSF